MPAVIALSLAAAFLFAASATIQQRATRIVREDTGRVSRARRSLSARLPVLLAIRGLLESPVWLLGWLVNLVGFFSQAAALHLGSVVVVQPIMVTQLLFTLPLVSLQHRRWPGVREWAAGAAICGGVAVFLAVRGGVSTPGGADRGRVLLAVAAAAVLVTLLVAASADQPPLFHSAGVAVAAGLCFATSAVLIKLTATDLFTRGVGATAIDWPGYALLGSTVLGVLLEQEAFRAGPLAVTMTAITITNPVASYFVGVLAFHVALPTTPGRLAAVAGSAALLTAGTAVLAGSPGVRRERALPGGAPGRVCPDVP